MKNTKTGQETLINDVIMYFRMPEHDVEVTVQFGKNPTFAIGEIDYSGIVGCETFDEGKQYLTTEGVRPRFSAVQVMEGIPSRIFGICWCYP